MRNSSGPTSLRAIYLCVFVSGFSGLLYQVVWHKYLAILLGAQARATAIVLAIFLGGLSAGYAAFGQWTRKLEGNGWKGYALVELGLGLWGLCFQWFFRAAMPVTSWLYNTIGVTSLFTDVLIALCLLFVPTFLMGGTLPILTQILSKDLQAASQTHARIYGINTLGACLGCFATGYLLVPSIGLPLTLVVGALFNLAAGAYVYVMYVKLAKDARPVAPVEGRPEPAPQLAPLGPRQIALGVVSFLSGFYLITLETVIIRLVGLSIGASHYTFTLIVGVFILGLGAGAMWLWRASRFSPSRLFWNQVGVALSLILVYVSVEIWPYTGHLIRIQLRDIASAFYLHQLLVGLAMLGVLFVPVALSGMTLPLCFHLLKDSERTLGFRVGQLYGVNTVGCVLGALLGGYAFLHVLDLDGVFKLCLFLVLLTAVAAAMLSEEEKKSWSPRQRAYAAGVLGLLVLVWSLPPLSKENFFQPFRFPRPTETSFDGPAAFRKHILSGNQYLFYKDGPNTSVGIAKFLENGREQSRTILVNGKSDGDTRGDRLTTTMLGGLPALFSRGDERACVIGFGTGITIGSLARNPDLKHIDVVEISGTLIQNASHFDAYNDEASHNPRVRFHEMDAFRFLEGTPHTFDIIISEPSNPWVQGIENLYTVEFYRMARKKLGDAGLFVQWIHTYSFNDELLRLVFRTMKTSFPHVRAFQLRTGDLALLASATPIGAEDLHRATDRFGRHKGLREGFAAAGVHHLETALALEILTPDVIDAMTQGAGPRQTLESPRLSFLAAKAFFAGQVANAVTLREQYRQNYTGASHSLLSIHTGGRPVRAEIAASFRDTFCDRTDTRHPELCEEAVALSLFVDPRFDMRATYGSLMDKRGIEDVLRFKPGARRVERSELSLLVKTYRRFRTPMLPLPLSVLVEPIEQCMTEHAGQADRFGDCALQRLALLEKFGAASGELQEFAKRYLTWFARIPPHTTRYPELANVRVYLENRIAEQR